MVCCTSVLMGLDKRGKLEAKDERTTVRLPGGKVMLARTCTMCNRHVATDSMVKPYICAECRGIPRQYSDKPSSAEELAALAHSMARRKEAKAER